MSLNITKAAKEWGVSRSTIYDKIRAGELSRNNDKTIEPVEMIRVFGEPKKNKNVQYKQNEKQLIQSSTIQNTLIEQELNFEKRLREEAEKRIEEANRRVEQANKRVLSLESQNEKLLGTINDLSQSIKLLEMKNVPEKDKQGFFAKFF